MKLPIQAAGIAITKTNTRITKAKSVYPAEFPVFYDTTFAVKRWLPSNFRFQLGNLPTSGCCLICRPGCSCCYAFSSFVLKT